MIWMRPSSISHRAFARNTISRCCWSCSLRFVPSISKKKPSLKTGFDQVQTRWIVDRTMSPIATPARRVVHLNHAGASPCPAVVMDRVVAHLQMEQAWGGYAAAEATDEQHELIYRDVAQFIGATTKTNAKRPGDHTDDHDEDTEECARSIALLESATVGWTRIFYAMAEYQRHRPQQNDKKRPTRNIILLSQVEYAANVVAACQWARTHEGWHVLVLPSSQNSENSEFASTGKVHVPTLRDILAGKYYYHEIVTVDDVTGAISADSSLGDEPLGHHSTSTNAKTTTAPRRCWLDPDRLAIICVTHIPTNSGVVNPVEEIGECIAAYNRSQQQERSSANDVRDMEMPSVFYLVDACQSVGQRSVDVQQIQCHGLVATGRKYLRGPRGTGFLFVRTSLLSPPFTAAPSSGSSQELPAGLWPHHVDHFGVPVKYVPVFQTLQVASEQGRPSDDVGLAVEQVLLAAPRPDARRFEFWESNRANRLGLGQALRHAASMGIPKLESKIRELACYLYEKLRLLKERSMHHSNRLCLYYPPESGLVTFWVSGVEAAWLGQQLWQVDTKGEGMANCFEVSVAPPTSTPFDSAQTRVPDMIRVSVSYTNNEEEIDQFVERIGLILSALHHKSGENAKAS